MQKKSGTKKNEKASSYQEKSAEDKNTVPGMTDIPSIMKMNPNLSIIVCTVHEPTHLWFTYSGIKEELKNTPHSSEIIISYNDEHAHGTYNKYLEHGVKLVHVQEQSTSTVRNEPAKLAKGDILCFADTHIIVGRDAFNRALKMFDAIPYLGVLHGSTTLWGNGDAFYSYNLTLEQNFWGTNNCRCKTSDKTPYAIPASGHGFYFIRRELFEQIGGYLDTQKSWGGEETFIDVLTWMYDYVVMVDPKINHYHLPGDFARPYKRNSNEFVGNLLAAAYVVGGQEWMDKVKEYYLTIPTHYDYVINKCAAIPKETEHRRIKVLKEAKYTLPEVIAMWKELE